MGAGETVSATAPSESMVSEEGNKFSKSQNRAVSNQPYYGTGPMTPPYFTPYAAAPATTYSIVFENQWPVLQRNVAPMQVPILYAQNGPFAHPHVVAGLASTTSKVLGNMHYQKDWHAMRKCSGSSENFEAVGDSIGESSRTLGSECQNTKQSRHEDFADKREAKAHDNEVYAIEKRSSQMLAEGSDAKNYNVSHFGGANNQVLDVGNYLVSMPQPHLNMMSSNVPSGKSKSKSKSKSEVVGSTESGVSAVSTKTAGCKEVKTDQPTQDECELVKERKRLAHSEAAKRSRIRRQQTGETLQTKVEELSTETSKLNWCLNRYSMDCVKLRRKNKALLDELRQKCSPEVIAELQSLNPDPDQSECPSDSSSDGSVESLFWLFYWESDISKNKVDSSTSLPRIK